MRILIFLLVPILLLRSCPQKEKVDLLVFNATIYTVNTAFDVKEAMAIRNGKIIAVNTSSYILSNYDSREKIDAKAKFIYPGFIDAHAHFLGYGLNLQNVDLVGTQSWDEIIEKLQKFASTNREGWLIGRGWDQNDWVIKQFPNKEKLDSLFPVRPVLLRRIDGHAAIVNQKALDIAGVKIPTRIIGGEIEVKNGKPTGILIDNAIDIVSSKIPDPGISQLKQALQQAEKSCFAAGLTTIDDCGLDYNSVNLIEELHKNNQLKMRLYVMLSDNTSNYNFLVQRGVIKTERLNVRSFKVYADGALGSRGACLLEPYSDKPGHQGFLLSDKEHFENVAANMFSKNFQMCTHAIGDSGNRVILNIYAKHLGGRNDRRWRIEHAQVVHKNDFDLFGKYSIIPSVQPTHATSDMYWAIDRLGTERVKGAYAYNDLLKQNGWIALGTDFPVEDIHPIKTFYAAVIRKDTKGWPENGFQVENALTREAAIRGMTIWAAKSNFEEMEKGSLEPGKFADFVILDKDLLTVATPEIINVNILATFINGEKVFEENNILR